MITGTYITAVKLALAITSVFAENRVCSPTACLEGKTSSSLLAFDSSTSTYLLPGTYQSDLYSPSGLINATISNTSSSLLISWPEYPVGFVEPWYGGTGDLWTTNNHTNIDWRSVYLPDTWYATLGEGKVLWGAIPDRLSLPKGVSGLRIQYTTSSLHVHRMESVFLQILQRRVSVKKDGKVPPATNALLGTLAHPANLAPPIALFAMMDFLVLATVLVLLQIHQKPVIATTELAHPQTDVHVLLGGLRIHQFLLICATAAFKDFSRTLWATVGLAQ
nr:hypothetical protein L204_00423 [Cryptococcus depauperatus CBS 7855]